MPGCHVLLRLLALILLLSGVEATQAANRQSLNDKPAATINNVRIWRDKEYTRIVFDLSTPVKYSLSSANNSNTITVDINNASLNLALDRLALKRTPLTSISSATINGNNVRITLELKQKVSPKSFFLKKEGSGGDRLVVDLYDAVDLKESTAHTSTPAKTGGAYIPPAAAATKTPVNNRDEPADIETLVGDTKPAVNLSGKRDILITVDAGHGGQDTGALGPNGMREKDITLAIAKELVTAINAQSGFSAHLTRKDDIFIPLKGRRDIARDKKADLFVSIHADAFANSLARGASVFALSRKGATSETARFLAQHENESDAIGGVAGVSLDDKDAVLAGVLVDLSMTATVNSSLLVGNQVLKSIAQIAPLHGRHVEQAGFVVLKSPDVPSILVETGFISNLEESRKLASDSYRAQMAQAIFKGLRQYFTQHPPAGSMFAEAQPQPISKNSAGERQHLVVRGDSLSNIAVRYKVKQSQLAKYNGLATNSSVRLGQILKIPAQ